MSTRPSPTQEPARDDSAPLARGPMEPWRNLARRIRDSLAERNFYVASSQDLGVLWSDERVDAVERRRRITVFAAQHHWRVDTRTDGKAARFHIAPPSNLFSSDIRSRNHE